MKLLFHLAFGCRRRWGLVSLAAVAMVLSCAASQLEMLSLSLLTPKGIDAFDLFSGEKSRDRLDRAQLEKSWNQLDTEGRGWITRRQAAANILIKEQKIGEQPLTRLRQLLDLDGHLSRLIALLVSIGIFKAICGFFQSYLTGQLYVQISKELCQRYFDHVQSMPLSFHRAQSVGQFVSRISQDAASAATAVNSLLLNYWQTPVLVVSSLVYLYWLSPGLFLLVFIELPALAAFIFLFTRRIRHMSHQILQQREDGTGVLAEFLGGIQTIKLFAREEFASRRFEKVNDQLALLETKGLRYNLLLRPLVHFVCTIFFLGVILWGTRIAQIPLSDLLTYCGLLYLIYEQIKKIAEENAAIQRGAAAADRLFEVLNVQPALRDAPGALEMAPFSSAISFRQVTFRYVKDQLPAVRNLSLSVAKGQFVAIVGETGAGKSTLVQLLARLYDVDLGSVEIDGLDIRSLSQRSLRAQMAFVPQHPFLFIDTIAANIAFGLAVDMTCIEDASRRAGADEFIQQLPQKYLTRLAEGGKNLSGGQQQRLAIARALVKKAPILILDEATSALDAVTEYHIRQTLKQLRGEITILVIAHRLTTIEDADEILYLSRGELLARGNHQQLLSSCPPFQQMWRAMTLERC